MGTVKKSLNFTSIAKKVLVIYGVALLSAYLFFRIQLVNLTPVLAIFSVILFIAEMHTILHIYGMFYSIWPRKYISYDKEYRNKNLQINIFICVCGEPIEIIRHTIEAAKKAAEYYQKKMNPKYAPRVVVLNDGYVAQKDNWRDIYYECKNQGVYHVKRRTPGGFKAANINNGLKQFPANDPHNTIDIILDSDFAVKKESLIDITKPLIDASIDFVQSPQRYQNEVTWVAKAAAAHQIFFFEHICPAKGHDNALFLCGTNFAIRRKALEEVGGVDRRFITEDYATSINLHLKGRKGVFLPKVLALGIAPSSLKAYFSQQQRWSKGNFDTTGAYLKQLFFGSLTWKQKFHYLLSASYYLIGLRDFILMLAPLPYLFFGVSLIKANTLTFLLVVYGPLLLYNFILYTLLFRHPIKSLVLDIVSFPVFTMAFLSSVVGKNLAFIVTIKKYQKENPFSVYRLQLFVMTILTSGLVYSTVNQVNHGFGAFINYFWAIFDVTFLSLGFILIIRENYNLKWLDGVALALFNPVKFLFGVALRPAISVFLLAMIVLSPDYSAFQILAFAESINIPSSNIREELLVPSDGAYYGYYLPDLNNHPKNPDVSLISNEKPSLVMFYQDWNSKSGFDIRFMNSLSEKNVIPVVTWEPWDSKNEDVPSVEQSNYYPKRITEGRYDEYIRKWARGAAEYKKPFFLRFAHEMNGNWYPWGNIENNTPQDYKEMWMHVYEIFRDEGATNVMWVWAPNNTDEYGDTESILDYYPGDNFVDWVGFSGFNWGTTNPINRWTPFQDIAREAYLSLTKLNKPIMITETSSVSWGGDKSAWFEETLRTGIPSFPKIKAVIFYHENFQRADFSLDENMDSEEIIEDNISNNGFYQKNPIIAYR